MIQTLYHVPEYKEEMIYPAVCRAMEALDIAGDMRPELKVVIKPNLIMAKKPEFPVTTHPLVIKAVVRWLTEHGVKDITLAESSGGLYNAEYMKNIYHVCGVKELSPQLKMNMDFSPGRWTVLKDLPTIPFTLLPLCLRRTMLSTSAS